MIFQDISCTRIGRYSSGERPQITQTHPIIQFLANEYYHGPLLKFDDENGTYCAKIPENSIAIPARINEFKDDKISVLDVGYSFGANLFLLQQLLQINSDKPVIVKGYDNDLTILKKPTQEKIVYNSLSCLLHPIVRNIIDRFFIEEKKDPGVSSHEQPVNFSLKENAKSELEKMLFYGNAMDLPEPDHASDATIGLYVLRYHDRITQLRIFRELIRVTKPGGYIFTEEFFFRREKNTVSGLSPSYEPAISFYDSKKALWYFSNDPERECIGAVQSIKELDKRIIELSDASQHPQKRAPV